MNTTKRPVRFFNTTGPCNPYDRYMLPPEERLVGAQLKRYIRDKLYWVLHAPLTSAQAVPIGKTTFLQSWMREINAGDEALACYVSVERCQEMNEIEQSMPAIYDAIQKFAGDYGLPIPDAHPSSAGSLLNEVLKNWAALTAPKPLIVLFDEVDVLCGNTLTSFLRQLRDGFSNRGIGSFRHLSLWWVCATSKTISSAQKTANPSIPDCRSISKKIQRCFPILPGRTLRVSLPSGQRRPDSR